MAGGREPQREGQAGVRHHSPAGSGFLLQQSPLFCILARPHRAPGGMRRSRAVASAYAVA